MTNNNVYVTKPSLPPLRELVPYLEEIWEKKILTNGGPFHAQLETALAHHLGVEHITLFANGTIALIAAARALGITGEVITTPYSFIATSHSLLWNGVRPIFVDVDPNTLNLDPAKIVAAISPNTTAIMPVHCYGYPCDTEAIKKIADEYKLKIIYDAAHAFGVEDSGGSILRHGDLSVLSFHATKVFNTFEGGAVVCANAELKSNINQLKNFGQRGELNVDRIGFNGKMNEFSAALGLLQLQYIDNAVLRRQQIDNRYREQLRCVRGIHCLNSSGATISNYSYFPILVEEDYPLARDELYQKLKEVGIHTRRYFYPLISEFSMYSDLPSAHPSNLPHATKAALQVLCLPMYPDLEDENVDRICEIIVGLSKSITHRSEL